MKVLGVVGAIGSGKSTTINRIIKLPLARFLKIKTLDLDIVAKTLISTNSTLRIELRYQLGPNVIDVGSNSVNSTYMLDEVFTNDASYQTLMRIMSVWITEYLVNYMHEIHKDTDLLIIEGAAIQYLKNQDIFDRQLVVWSNNKYNRVVDRNKYTVPQIDILQRRSTPIKSVDYSINTDGTALLFQYMLETIIMDVIKPFDRSLNDIIEQYHAVDFTNHPYHNQAHAKSVLINAMFMGRFKFTDFHNYELSIFILATAAYLHDYVIDTVNGNSEHQTVNALKKIKYTQSVSDEYTLYPKISNLILNTGRIYTNHLKITDLSFLDKALILSDISLLLSDNDAALLEYNNAIRLEYNHVSDEEFYRGRIGFLQKLLINDVLIDGVIACEQFKLQFIKNVIFLIDENCKKLNNILEDKYMQKPYTPAKDIPTAMFTSFKEHRVCYPEQVAFEKAYTENIKPVASHRMGIYPGSFNPLHVGHLEILQKASEMCDTLVLLRCINNNKPNSTNLRQSEGYLVDKLPNNCVITDWDGLMIDFVHSQLQSGELFIIRGIRNPEDVQSELNYKQYLIDSYKSKYGTDLPPVIWIPTSNTVQHVSSTAIRYLTDVDPDFAKSITI